MSGTVVIRFVAQTRARKDNLKQQWPLDSKRFGRRSVGPNACGHPRSCSSFSSSR